jgi:hypothetical protein
METIKRGSTGESVRLWQKIIGAPVDGVFGARTEGLTKAWQLQHGLTPDGVVGPATWTAAGGILSPDSAPPIGRVETVPYGSRIIDSYPLSLGGTVDQVRALKLAAVDGVVVYASVASPMLCAAIVSAGMGLLAVTRAGEYNDGSADEIAWARKVGYPAGASFALDFEGLPAFEAGKKDPIALMGLLKAWASEIRAAGWRPVLYLGSPQPLTSAEIDSLGFDGVWLGIGSAHDRANALVYPPSGYVLRQDWHGDKNGIEWRTTGVLVDHNSAQKDHRGRSLSWVVSA